MPRTAIQLQTLDGLDRPLPETIERIGETALNGVEFAGLGGATPAAVAAALDDAGLEVVGAHVDPARIEADYDDVIESYREIGCTRLIFPGRDPETFRTAGSVQRLAERLSGLASRLADDGFDLCYHNDRYEFGTPESHSAFETFVDSLDGVGLEIDTGLAAYGGADPVSLLRRHRDRTPLVHLTDSVEGSPGTAQVELGAGTVDVEGCVDACLASDVEWLVYEHGRTNDPPASLHHGETRMASLIEQVQRKQTA